MAARNPWPAWRGYCYRTKPTGASKSEMSRFKRTIKQEWAAIRERHPDDHAQLKRQLLAAIERVKVMEARQNRYAAVIQELEEIHQATVPGTGGRVLSIERYERAALAVIEHLGAVKTLIDVEELIGRPTHRMRIYEETKREGLMDAAITATEAVRIAREREDIDIRSARQQQHQETMDVQPMRGGRMQHVHLSNSGMATVGLWLSGDDHGNITDRIVVKDQYYIEDYWKWTGIDGPKWWIGNNRDFLNRVPGEVHITQRLNATRTEHIVKMRGWQTRPHQLLVRLFLEYCPYGEGNDLIFHHKLENWENKNKDSFVPEPVIWCIFESIAFAGLIMERGAYENPSPRWSPIKHLDIKPENLLFGDYPSQDGRTRNFAMYPTVKLADFGLSLDGWKHAIDSKYGLRGTPGFLAPEQHDIGADRPAYNTNTDIWGTGATILSFMNLHSKAGEIDFSEPAKDESDPALVPEFRVVAEERYSKPLRDLVQRCVQYRPADRPSFHELLIEIRRHTGMGDQGATDHAQGARFAKRDAIPEGLTEMPGLIKEKEYALGMAMPA